jgi:hypothetical protein
MKSFDKITKLKMISKNELFLGTKGKQKYFIKRYIVRPGREKEDLLKVKCEILCYKNIKDIGLLKVVETDYNNRFLVLEFVKFSNIKISEKEIDNILFLYLNKISKVNANFLPKVNFDYYKNSLYKRALILKQKRVINNIERIYNNFKSNKILINKSSKYFSHGDLDIRNIKYLNGNMTLIDFEHSRRDNLMYDLASLYVNIYWDDKLANYLLKKIKKFNFYNEKLFLLMIYRRSIEVLYASMERPNSKEYEIAKNLINKEIINI